MSMTNTRSGFIKILLNIKYLIDVVESNEKQLGMHESEGFEFTATDIQDDLVGSATQPLGDLMSSC